VRQLCWGCATLLTRICVLLLLLLLFPAAPGHAAVPFPDLEEHWAAGAVAGAVARGWVSGYPDGTFRPDGPITRAEFVKLLAAALRLAPGSGTARFLADVTGAYPGEAASRLGMADHWLYGQGWLSPALSLGILLPGSYASSGFTPDQPIPRHEIAAMVVRALGLGGRAEAGLDRPRFADEARIPASSAGYVGTAAASGVIGGYPDGSFAPLRPATRAEAIVIVSRLVARMEEGADSSIMLLVRKPQGLYPNDMPQTAPLAVPALIADGHLYIPARSLFEAAATKLYPDLPVRFEWDPARQALHFLFGMPYSFRAGDVTFRFPPDREHDPPLLPVAARLLYGEIVIPVYNLKEEQALLGGQAVWEPVARMLILPVERPIQ
jgi:hypothetical protein